MKYREREIIGHKQEVLTTLNSTSSTCSPSLDREQIKHTAAAPSLLSPTSCHSRLCDEMPPKSGYRYRYSNGTGGDAVAPSPVATTTTQTLSPIHQHHHHHQRLAADQHQQPLEDVKKRLQNAFSTPPTTQLKPRLPRTSISKIPRHVQGAAEQPYNDTSAPNSLTNTPMHYEQQEPNTNTCAYHQIESSDENNATIPTTLPIHNTAKSRYLTFSKDQATSHFKQLQEELGVVSINPEQEQQQQVASTHSPHLSAVIRRKQEYQKQQQQHQQQQEEEGKEKQQDHQQMTIDISDRQPLQQRHFRRRRDEQPLISQINNVYDNLLSVNNECKTTVTTTTAAITSQRLSPPTGREETRQFLTNNVNEQQVKAQLTSPLVRPRPLDRLSKQQVIVDNSVMHDDMKCDNIHQFIDVVGLDESDDYGGDRIGGVVGPTQQVQQQQRQVATKPCATTTTTITSLHDELARHQPPQQQQQPICEAFIMTGQSMLKLSCNETENSINQTTSTTEATKTKTTTSNTTAITSNNTNSKNDNLVDRTKTIAVELKFSPNGPGLVESIGLPELTSETPRVEQKGRSLNNSIQNNNNNNNNINNEYCSSVGTTPSFERSSEIEVNYLPPGGGDGSGDISCANKEEESRRQQQQQRRSSRVDEQEAQKANERAVVVHNKHEHRFQLEEEGQQRQQQQHNQQRQQRFLSHEHEHEHGEPEEGRNQELRKQTSEQPTQSSQIFEHITLFNHHKLKPKEEVQVSSQLVIMEPSEKPTTADAAEETQKPDATETQASCHDRESARRLAKRLYNLSGFKRPDVCHHLAKNNPFSQMVAEEYLCLFDFRSIKLDAALRKFLSKLQLNGETQERERVLSQFSQRYYDCNKEKFPSSDTIQTLVCAMILLNTDLHGNHFDKKLKRNKRTKLSLGAFIDGLNNSIASEPGQCGNGQSANLASQISTSNINPVTTPNNTTPPAGYPPYTFPRHLLVDLYESIKKRPLKCGEDKCDMTSYEAELDRIYSQQLGMSGANSRSSTLPTRRFAPGSHAPSSTLSANSRRQLKSGLGRMHSSEIDFSIEFKSGFLNRKRTFESARKPTAKGRRGWRRVFIILKDLRLIIRYNQEEDHHTPGEDDKQQMSAKQQQISSKLKKQMIARDMKNTIKLHHAFAKRLPSYTKREYVFQVLFADQSEMLMQASCEQEMDLWIDTINFASACLSSPALPTAVSNSKRYLQRYQARSILPSSYTKLSYWEQLIDHEERLQRLKQELEEHLNEAPNTRNADKRSKSEFIEKIAYLRLDIERYSVYVDLMRKKSNSPEAIILSKHPQIASLTPSDEMIANLPSFAPPAKLDENSPSGANQVTTTTGGAL